MPAPKASTQLLQNLGKRVSSDEGKELAKKVKGLILFVIDGEHWSLKLRPDEEPSLNQGEPDEKPDLTLTMSDAVFSQLVAGKLNPQTAFLMRKLKLNGSMGLAMKLNPVLEAAAPKAKL